MTEISLIVTLNSQFNSTQQLYRVVFYRVVALLRCAQVDNAIMAAFIISFYFTLFIESSSFVQIIFGKSDDIA